MKFVNLTPHDIVLASGENNAKRMTIPASGIVARVSSTPGAAETIDGVPVPVMGRQTWGSVEGLPDPVPNTLYIVSGVVLARPECQSRMDVVGPGTGPNDNAIRYTDGPRKGQVEAVTRLVRG